MIVAIETIAVRSPAAATPAMTDIYDSENNTAGYTKTQKHNYSFFFKERVFSLKSLIVLRLKGEKSEMENGQNMNVAEKEKE